MHFLPMSQGSRQEWNFVSGAHITPTLRTQHHRLLPASLTRIGPVSSAECYSSDFCSHSIKCQHPLMLSLSAILSTLVTPLSLHNSCSAFLYVQPSATSPPPSALPPAFIVSLSHFPSSLFMLQMKLVARPCGGQTLCRWSRGNLSCPQEEPGLVGPCSGVSTFQKALQWPAVQNIADRMAV